MASGTQKRKLEGHTHWVTSVAISHDNKSIVSGSYDETIRCAGGAGLRQFTVYVSLAC
jgi:hypothetical protein